MSDPLRHGHLHDHVVDRRPGLVVVVQRHDHSHRHETALDMANHNRRPLGVPAYDAHGEDGHQHLPSHPFGVIVEIQPPSDPQVPGAGKETVLWSPERAEEGRRLRELGKTMVGDAIAAGTEARARELDPLGDPMLLRRGTQEWQELAEKTLGTDLAMAQTYRRWAGLRHIADLTASRRGAGPAPIKTIAGAPPDAIADLRKALGIDSTESKVAEALKRASDLLEKVEKTPIPGSRGAAGAVSGSTDQRRGERADYLRQAEEYEAAGDLDLAKSYRDLAAQLAVVSTSSPAQASASSPPLELTRGHRRVHMRRDPRTGELITAPMDKTHQPQPPESWRQPRRTLP